MGSRHGAVGPPHPGYAHILPELRIDQEEKESVFGIPPEYVKEVLKAFPKPMLRNLLPPSTNPMEQIARAVQSYEERHLRISPAAYLEMHPRTLEQFACDTHSLRLYNDLHGYAIRHGMTKIRIMGFPVYLDPNHEGPPVVIP